MNEQIAKDWIAELRDPNNKQGTAALRKEVLLEDGTVETRRCCLGVLADMAVKAGVIDATV